MSFNSKQAAVEFLSMVVSGQIDLAYDQYVDLSGKHHNMYFPKGFPALRQAMKENHKVFPHKQFDIKQVIAMERRWRFIPMCA